MTREQLIARLEAGEPLRVDCNGDAPRCFIGLLHIEGGTNPTEIDSHLAADVLEQDSRSQLEGQVGKLLSYSFRRSR